MKKLSGFALLSILAVLFTAGVLSVFKFITPYIEKINEQSVENGQSVEVKALAFSEDIVKTFKSGSLEKFKQENPQYSFLVPKGEENYFIKQLKARNNGIVFEIVVEEINKERQRIRYSEDYGRTMDVYNYEATADQVFPVSTTFVNWRYTPIKFLFGSIGGAMLCLIFFIIYRKYLD